MARSKYKPPTDAPPYRVLLVEDHAIVREGLAAILSSLPGEFTICSQAATSRAAREIASAAQPHLIITDFFLGDSDDGTRLIADLSTAAPQTRILVLSLSDENDLAERTLRAGAHGYLVKSRGTDHLLDAARVVLRGGLYISPELQARLLDRVDSTPPIPLAASPIASLTERELQIFQLLGTELSAEKIATRLGLSPRTICSHCENIKNKLNYSTLDTLRAAARAWLKLSYT